jgi:hypothetical protein
LWHAVVDLGHRHTTRQFIQRLQEVLVEVHLVLEQVQQVMVELTDQQRRVHKLNYQC